MSDKMVAPTNLSASERAAEKINEHYDRQFPVNSVMLWASLISSEFEEEIGKRDRRIAELEEQVRVLQGGHHGARL